MTGSSTRSTTSAMFEFVTQAVMGVPRDSPHILALKHNAFVSPHDVISSDAVDMVELKFKDPNNSDQWTELNKPLQCKLHNFKWWIVHLEHATEFPPEGWKGLTNDAFVKFQRGPLNSDTPMMSTVGKPLPTSCNHTGFASSMCQDIRLFPTLRDLSGWKFYHKKLESFSGPQSVEMIFDDHKPSKASADPALITPLGLKYVVFRQGNLRFRLRTEMDMDFEMGSGMEMEGLRSRWTSR